MFKRQSLTIQDLKKRGAKALSENEVRYLIVNSRVKSAILPIDVYETMIEELENIEDIKAYKERKDEETLPLEEAVREIEKRNRK